MDYSQKIDAVRSRIDELRRIKEILVEIEDTVYSIEKELSSIDTVLPSDSEIASMPSGEEKAQILHLIDLDNEAFDLIDEILGPPEDAVTGQPEGTAFSPEARGNKVISLDEALSGMIRPGGKNKAS